MLVSTLLALFLAILISAVIYGWLKLGAKIFLKIKKLGFRGFDSLRLYWRLPAMSVDFDSDCFVDSSHYSLDNPSFSRKHLGNLLWGARFALFIEGFRISFSPNRMKIILKIARISVFYNILPDIFSKGRNKSKSNRKFHNNIFKLLQIFFSVEIEQIDVVVTTMPGPVSKYDSILFAGIQVMELSVFKDLDHLSLKRRPPFSCANASISMCEFSTKTFEDFPGSKYHVGSIPSVVLNIALTDDTLRFDIASGPIQIDIRVNMLLFISTIFHMKQSYEDTVAEETGENRLLFSLALSSININCFLPDLEDPLKPISRLRLLLDNVEYDLIVDGGAFKYLGSVNRATFGAFFTENADEKMFTRCDQILNRIPAGDAEHVLVSVDALVVTNSDNLRNATRTELLSNTSVKALIKSLLDGNVCWDFFSKLDDSFLAETRPHFESMELSKKLDFLLYSNFHQTSTVLLMTKLSFSIPFEFPLSYLVDSLAYMIKSTKMMHRLEVTPQSFDVFTTKWEILLSCPDVSWKFGDDPFESKLSRIMQIKQKVVRRFARLERMFWNRSDKESRGMKISASDEKLPASQLAFAKSASFTDLNVETTQMVNKYMTFHESLFSLYKKEVRSFPDASNDGMMDVKIANVDLKLRWSPEYLSCKGIHDLLNAMENSQSGYSQEMVEKASLSLGAYMEFSGQRLNAYLRDFESEFISFNQFQICGPIFLLEEGAYPEACLKVPVKTGICSGLCNACPEIVNVLTTVLPVKVFHSLGARLGGEYGFKSAFSPYWDGMFVGLDRAFDMLSKQSLELSPRLPIWDKYRLFVHSSFAYMCSASSCYFSFYPGKSGFTDESLVIKLVKGFTMEMRPDRVIFEFDEFEGLVGSRSLAMLWYLLQSQVANLNAAITSDGAQLLRLVHFAKTRFTLSLSAVNNAGERPIEHQRIRMAASNIDTSPDYDSFADFRLKSMVVNLEVVTDDAQKADVTSLYLYDELINWVKENLLGYALFSVRKGPLFVSPFISVITEGKDSIVSIVDEIHFKFHFDGAFSCAYLNFYDGQTYGGLHLSSTETTIELDYAKSRPVDETSGLDAKWIYYFGSVDFRNINLDVVSSEPCIRSWTERFRAANQIRILPSSILSMELISAPRLFYTCIDDLCFAHDPKAREAQLRSNQKHQAQQQKRIADLEGQVVAGNAESLIKELGILKEQQKMIVDIAGGDNVEKHFYFIHEAKLYWHRGLRNEVYRFTDQQFVRHMIRSSKSRLSLESIRRMNLDQARPGSTSSPRPSSPFGKGPSSPLGNDSSEDVRQFYETLMKRSTAMYVLKEEANTACDNGITVDLRSPLEVVSSEDNLLALEKLSNVYFYSAQLILADDSGKTAALTAPFTSVEVGSLVDVLVAYEDNLAMARVGTRTKVSLENLTIFLSDQVTWGADVPYERITEPASAAVIFNSKDAHYTGKLHLGGIGLDKGHSLTVFAPELKLFMSSVQYDLLSQLISRLLVYRDAGQRQRAEQLEALVLASDVLDKGAVVEMVSSLQARVHRLESSLTDAAFTGNVREDRLGEKLELLKVLSNELGLIVESMATIRSSKAKWGKKQVRLQMDAIVDCIELTMMRPDRTPMIALTLRSIHDTWVSDEDFSMSNLIEIGVILAMNKTPGSFYKTLLEPLPKSFYQAAGIGLGFSDQAVRLYWKTLIPIGGIPIIEHAELNLSPHSIQLNYETAAEATRFFLPQKPKGEGDLDNASFQVVEAAELAGEERKSMGSIALARGHSFQAGNSASLSRMESMEEIMSMKQKAADHCSFVSIRVPATQQYISYKVLIPLY